ncbi:hypothetical protein EYC80_003802 [Monilinia laxa]|uniref:Uncharacterized protein n=1 Tax=Monilinia laxa TaxID=61186 RepID=A0A5N6KL53_MONLA|nr:hypothetical protein EYC80_003802 [Monilinia laxa]
MGPDGKRERKGKKKFSSLHFTSLHFLPYFFIPRKLVNLSTYVFPLNKPSCHNFSFPYHFKETLLCLLISYNSKIKGNLPAIVQQRSRFSLSSIYLLVHPSIITTTGKERKKDLRFI